MSETKPRKKYKRKPASEHDKQYRREWYQRNKVRRNAIMRETAYARNYGITVAIYDQMLEEQGGGCAICGRVTGFEGKRLAVDHCHESGKVRGLLCDSCNMGIGSMGHNPDIALRAAQYLLASINVS